MIKVTETGEASSKTIQVQVIQDPINLTGQGRGPVPIKWDIDPTSTAGWSFAANGIVIDSPSNKFGNDGPANGNKRYGWTRNRDQADGQFYKYSISVTNGATTVIVDPIIINEP
jgi:hypothetical protein